MINNNDSENDIEIVMIDAEKDYEQLSEILKASSEGYTNPFQLNKKHKYFDIYELKCMKGFFGFLLKALIFSSIIIIILSIYILFKSEGTTMNSVIQDILIGLATGVISSIGVTLVAYYKFLKEIPENTQEKINKLLNERLNYETSNHNHLESLLNPSNKSLSDDHRFIHKELSNIDKNVSILKEQNKTDYSLLNDAENKIVQSVKDVSKFQELFLEIYKENKYLKQKLSEAEKHIEKLNRENNTDRIYEKANEISNKTQDNLDYLEPNR